MLVVRRNRFSECDNGEVCVGFPRRLGVLVAV